MLNLHLCVRRSGVLGVEMKTLPVKHTARTLSGSPSTRAAIAMDGGVAVNAALFQHNRIALGATRL